jgi:hypothetical protein
MRVMVKFRFPAEIGNELVETGKAEKVIKALLQDLKPEAAYFFNEFGERAGFFIMNMQDSSEIAGVSERIFFGLNAEIDMIPVMTAEELAKGLTDIERIIENYG